MKAKNAKCFTLFSSISRNHAVNIQRLQMHVDPDLNRNFTLASFKKTWKWLYFACNGNVIVREWLICLYFEPIALLFKLNQLYSWLLTPFRNLQHENILAALWVDFCSFRVFYLALSNAGVYQTCFGNSLEYMDDIYLDFYCQYIKRAIII